jgi:hypothetical protein
VITLNLTIKQPTASSVSVSNCGPYTWPVSGLTYATSGMYKDTLQNVAGCDSVITLNLTIIVAPVPTVQADTTIALGASITLTATGCTGTLLWFKASDSTAVTMPVSPTVTTNYYAKCQTTGATSCISAKSADVKVKVSTGFVISIKSGNWEDPTTWDSGSVPTATDVVTIDSTHTVNITTSTATAKKLNFNANSTLNYANSTAKLTVAGL